MRRGQKNGSYDIINQAYKLYDVVWVLALALSSTDAMIKENVTMITECENATGSLVSLEEFELFKRADWMSHSMAYSAN